jgi:eukaryotic-like serine/threonine-protein kinase
MPTIEELTAALPDDISVVREIHWGGQRIVYEVTVGDERRVLKLMPEAARARAEREVAIGRSFDHPNLSTVLDQELRDVSVGANSYVYFTEAFIDGNSLAARTDGMQPCEALRLAQDLVSAVAYLWEHHHVVHRDIKPLNIMIRPTGTFVLLDIGVARHQDMTTLTLVAGEHQPGTIGYLAPEQLAPLKGRELDYRADLFAIGIVIYEQLKGCLPFDPNAASYRTLLTAGLVPDLEDLPAAFETLLRRFLAARPHGRFRLDRAPIAITQAMEELGCS